MISDGVHFLSNVISSIGVFIGLKISQKTADYEHPYRHEKFEALSSEISAFLLFMTGLSIEFSATQTDYFRKLC